MAEANPILCILCDNDIEESSNLRIGEQAIQSLIKASKEIGDKKHVNWTSFVFANVHKKCKNLYLKPSYIESKKKATSEKLCQLKRDNKEARRFDFGKLCFFCGNDAVTNTHKNPVRIVSSDETKSKILSTLATRVDTEERYKQLNLRLQFVDNLQNKNARYHASCMQVFYTHYPTKNVGRPMDENMTAVVNHVINHILNNSDDPQFSLKEMIESFRGNLPRIALIKEHIQNYFEDDIVMYTVPNNTIICYVNRQGSVLDEQWYKKKCPTDDQERLRVVEMAANIIRQDIRSRHYDTDYYKAPSSFLSDVEQDIPPTLHSFLNTLVKDKKRSEKSLESKWAKRVSTIAHILISCVRPRTFLSSILLGLSSFIHKKFAARGLLDALSYLGLCASYHETLLFEASIINDPEQFKIADDAFVQYCFDNADHQTNTIDGYKTFHAMGGIACVTPSSSVTSTSLIKRLRSIPKSVDVGKFGFLPLKLFERGTSKGLKNVIVRNFELDNELKISTADFVWLHQKTTHPLETKGWTGFQEGCHSNIEYETSRIIPIPFVNNTPSDYNTIFTVLVEAARRCRARGQKTCFVTFDLPLYLKAREIISCIDPANDPHSLLCIVVRLGGFHMIMSFLGTTKFIMKGSGLEQAFCVLFAEKSAEKALEGHAYSRSIRGHTLVQASLAAKIFDEITLSEEEISCLAKYPQIDLPDEDAKTYSNEVESIKNKFINKIQEIEGRGPTCKLWILYFRLVNIVKRFIEAERLGNWKLHKECVKNMLPYFHASGHNQYAKCSHMYLQDMEDLESSMDIFEYDKFAKCGYFTIRRTEKAWSGIFTDMTIEQVLMKSMKCQGGLTHGRGITDSVVAKWILSTIALTEVSTEMEKFCNVSFDTSEQHVDTRISRIKRDAEDLQKVNEYFEKYNPFIQTDVLMSIYSGVVGNDSINCHESYERGCTVFQSHIGKSFADMKSSTKNKVQSLSCMTSSIKIDGDVIAINPLLIFQRICMELKTQDDMQKYLQYELAPFPLSLFDENGMRKTEKAAFYDNFKSLSELPEISDNDTFVLDGGSLLHRVVWQRNITVKEIINTYVRYVSKYKKAMIVFDGYPEDTSSSLKTLERLRRQRKNGCREFVFDDNTKITEKPTTFLSNDKNKARLIGMLSLALQNAGYETLVAEEDADKSIIETAASVDASVNNVIIVGEDVDLIVLSTHFTPKTRQIFHWKRGKGQEVDKWYTNDSFLYPQLSKYVMFLHAVTGCDTVSCLFKQGKNKLVKAFLSNPQHLHLMDIFYEKDAVQDDIAKNMCKIISLLYCNTTEGSLNEHRFQCFKQAIARGSFHLENIPPTEGAATQHAFRVYLQLQKWLGYDYDVTQWGWKIAGDLIIPVYSKECLIPEDIIKKISCGCTTGCKTKICGCRKNFIKCTNLCKNCDSTNCNNFEITQVDNEEDSLDVLENMNESITNLYQFESSMIVNDNFPRFECEPMEQENVDDDTVIHVSKRMRYLNE